MKPKILAVVGQTATGKSDLAVELAQNFNGEIISADSRQVYCGLDIGTGKITTEEMCGVPHHLLDVADPNDRFSVAEFKKQAEQAIEDILARGKLPILCGGTGFYIQSIVDGITPPQVPADGALRDSLENISTEELFTKLQKLDPERAETIDPGNKVRLIRAIEIARALGSVPKQEKDERYDVLQIGITFPDEELRKRIHDRLVARIDSGMIEEAERLHANGLSYERMEELGLEYRYLAKFLKQEISREELVSLLTTKIWQYAKRQKTWFKRDERIKWFALEQREKIKTAVRNFLQ